MRKSTCFIFIWNNEAFNHHILKFKHFIYKMCNTIKYNISISLPLRYFYVWTIHLPTQHSSWVIWAKTWTWHAGALPTKSAFEWQWLLVQFDQIYMWGGRLHQNTPANTILWNIQHIWTIIWLWCLRNSFKRCINSTCVHINRLHDMINNVRYKN